MKLNVELKLSVAEVRGFLSDAAPEYLHARIKDDIRRQLHRAYEDEPAIRFWQDSCNTDSDMKGNGGTPAREAFERYRLAVEEFHFPPG